MSGYDFFCYLVSFFLPPLGVFMKRGIHSEFWINILLTLLGYIPGIIHAFYVVHKYRDSHHWAPSFVRPPARGHVGAGYL